MPDEVITRVVYPLIRSLVAKRLIEIHRLNQKEVADILSVTQAAVSYYLSNKRGTTKNLLCNEEIEAINKLVDEFVSKNITKEELFVEIIKLIQNIIRTRELCLFHKYLEKDLDINGCNICEIRYFSIPSFSMNVTLKNSNE